MSAPSNTSSSISSMKRLFASQANSISLEKKMRENEEFRKKGKEKGNK